MRANSFSSFALLCAGTLLGIHAFAWPLYLPDSDFFLFQPDSARAFALLTALIAISVVSIDISKGALDSKSVAILGVLAALIASLRLVGAGAIGVEPMWFLLIIASFVFGSRTGFALGVLSLAISSIITGGIGPWLPFQMIAAGWIGLVSGVVGNTARNFSEVKQKIALVGISIFSSLSFGFLMDLQLWPWIAATDTQLSFLPGDSIANNLEKFVAFHFATALAWDIPRALTTATLVVMTATPIMKSLERAKSRLAFTSHAMAQTVPSK